MNNNLHEVYMNFNLPIDPSARPLVKFFEDMVNTLCPSADLVQEQPKKELYDVVIKSIQNCENVAKEASNKIVEFMRQNLKDLFTQMKEVYKQENSFSYFIGLAAGFGLSSVIGETEKDGLITFSKFKKVSPVLTAGIALFMPEDKDSKDGKDAKKEENAGKNAANFFAGACTGVFIAFALKKVKQAAKGAMEKEVKPAEKQEAAALPGAPGSQSSSSHQAG